MNTTAKGLRTRTKEILDAVDRGEEVVVTFRGRARAKIIPIAAQARSRSVAAENPLFGIWKDDETARNVKAFVDRARAPRP